MTAVGYCRVSTDRQAQEGASLAAQEDAIRRWAASRETLVPPTLYTDEGLSGSRADNRPQLALAIDHACRTRGVLVVYSLSRLARSTRDAIEIAERLEKCRANLVSLSENIDTTTATGKVIFTVFAAFAQFERDLTSERTRAALQWKKAQGQRVSRFAPFGFRFEPALCGEGSLQVVVADDREQGVIRAILDWHEEGLNSVKIAALLDEGGIPTRSGNPWRPSSVRRIIACHKN